MYDLAIESELEVPMLDELLVKKQPIDVKIELGVVPQIREEIIIQNAYSKISRHEYLCEVKGVVTFYVGYGFKIVVQIEEGAEMETVYLFLLGHMVGVLLGQRETVAIHSSSIIINDQAFLVCGYAGAGKTTTSALLVDRGYKLLADDIAAIKIGDKDHKIRTCRGFAQQKFCPDIIKRMNMCTEGMYHMTYQKEKYHAMIPEHFGYKSTILKGIFEIRKTENTALRIIEVKGREKLAYIINNIFLRTVKDFSGMTRDYMDQLIRIAQNVSFFVVERPSEEFTGNQIVDYIVDYAHQK